jgi:hypothetical protein
MTTALSLLSVFASKDDLVRDTQQSHRKGVSGQHSVSSSVKSIGLVPIWSSARMLVVVWKLRLSYGEFKPRPTTLREETRSTNILNIHGSQKHSILLVTTLVQNPAIDAASRTRFTHAGATGALGAIELWG